jgi:N4-gp56 family major capsid protein
MTIQTVSAAAGALALADSVRARYLDQYEQAAEMVRLYDQIAAPVGSDMSRLARGTSVVIPTIADMNVGTTAISEVVDITPQALEDTTTSITPTSRAEALQCSELLLMQAYTDYGAQKYRAVGKNAMESIDVLARDAACKGDLVIRETVRADINAGSTGHRANDKLFTKASTMLSTLKCPGFPVKGGSAWAAIMHPAAYHDIREDGNVQSIAQYQQANIILNYELGSIGPFRLVVSPWAKVFGGAGAPNDNIVNTTLACQGTALDKTITVASSTHMDNFDLYYTIGTEETGSTHYPMNEIVRYISHVSKVATIVGEGPNGGLRFTHATSTAVRNDDNVYTIVLGGPESLVKIYQPSVGPYGTVVGPKRDGLVDQFVSLGWKFYGGYAIFAQNRIVRAEVSSSVQA